MALNIWAAHLLVAMFFGMGFITYYEWHVRVAFEVTEASPLMVEVKRWSLPAVVIIVCLWLQVAITVHNTGMLLYLCLQLFVYAYPLLNDQFTNTEFWIQGAVGGLFWFVNHPFHLDLFVAVLIALMLLGGALRYFREGVRYSWVAHIVYAAILASVYFWSYTGLNWQQRSGYWLIFMLMSIYSCAYSNVTHRHYLEREQLQREVKFDTLTKAKSYTSFLTESKQLLQQMQQSHQPLTFVEVDLDNFKSINDQYSHLAGNGALVQATQAVKQCLMQLASEWQLYRTGGEEFVILLPTVDITTAIPLIRQSWQALRSLNYHYDQERITITGSFGVTALQTGDVVIDDLYQRADNSLYISKQHGRDCITVDGQPLSVNSRSTVVVTHTFFTQPVIQLDSQATVCQELLMRVFDEGHWMLPREFDLGITTQVSMMQRLLNNLPGGALGINLTLAQFTDLHNAAHLLKFVKQTPRLQELTLELNQVPTLEMLQSVGQQYRASQIQLLLDAELTQAELPLVRTLIPYIDGIKLDLHQFHPGNHVALHQWQALMAQHHKKFVLKGIETKEDYQLARTLKVTYGQGYHFSRPVMPKIM